MYRLQNSRYYYINQYLEVTDKILIMIDKILTIINVIRL